LVIGEGDKKQGENNIEEAIIRDALMKLAP
jgi:hypothetical protein